MVLGAKRRKLDLRDIKLGEVQAPITIPDSYKPDVSWLTPNYQGALPTCSSHAGSHLKAILEYDPHQITQRFSPEYLWVNIKQLDGIPLEDGTDMRSIFQSLKKSGICDWNLLPDDLTLSLEAYSAPARVTFDMQVNAQMTEIASYAFSTPENIKQDIYQNQAVLILLDVNDVGGNWWGNSTPTYDPNQENSGHFVCAYGYDSNYIYIVDSADQNVPFKCLPYSYPLVETGVAVDLAPAVVAQKTQGVVTLLQKLVNLYQQLLTLLS